ncbi:MAG: electron transport complex subunit RsxC [Chitinivibrionales bacterium]|nr:electron transport complex subunit RsxC [Chitinivibrionales bacterium]
MFGWRKFRRGVILSHYEPRGAPSAITDAPLPARVFIPLLQHRGLPAIPIVKYGDVVLRGQLIAEAPLPQSITMHAPVSGTVSAVAPWRHPSGKKITAIHIESDGRDMQADFLPLAKPWREAAQGEIVQKVLQCGIAGMSGSGVPAHIKLAPPADKPIDILLVNGLDGQPPVQSAAALQKLETENTLEGALIVKKTVAAKRIIVAIDKTRTEILKTIEALRKDKRFAEIEVRPVSAAYPLGEEITLIYAMTGRAVLTGQTPQDLGCVVFSTSTLLAIFNAVVKGQPLYDRVVTVAGPAIGRPANLRVRIGTPVAELLEIAAVNNGTVKKIIMGGPMTGLAIAERDTPVIKTTTAVIALDYTTPPLLEFDCIRCSACFQVCPRRLAPTVLAHCVKNNDIDKAAEWGIARCCACGCCTYVCPSKINLAHYIALGNYHLQSVKQAGRQ